MSSRKLYFILIAVLVLVNVGGVALLVTGNKYLNKQNAKLTDLKVESDTLDTVQRSLIKAKKDVETYSDLAKVVESVVPQEKDQARTVREIVKISEESSVTISGISFPTSTLGSTSAAKPANGSTAGTVTQTQKVDGISNVERLEITVNSGKDIPYDNFILFLQKLEQNRRTSQVSSITVTPNTKDPRYVKFTLILNVYIKKAGS